MLRIAATLLMICFSLTHAGASSLFAPLTINPEKAEHTLFSENEGVNSSEFDTEATVRCCMGDEIAPVTPCKNSDCHYLLQEQRRFTTPDYFHVISVEIGSMLIDRQADSLLRPPIDTI